MKPTIFKSPGLSQSKHLKLAHFPTTTSFCNQAHTRVSAWLEASQPDFAAPLIEKEQRDHCRHLKRLLASINKWLLLKTRCCYRRTISTC